MCIGVGEAEVAGNSAGSVEAISQEVFFGKSVRKGCAVSIPTRALDTDEWIGNVKIYRILALAGQR